MIVENFNTLLSTMDRLSRMKINKETLDLNYTLDQMDLNIYRSFHQTAAGHTLLKHNKEHSPEYII